MFLEWFYLIFILIRKFYFNFFQNLKNWKIIGFRTSVTLTAKPPWICAPQCQSRTGKVLPSCSNNPSSCVQPRWRSNWLGAPHCKWRLGMRPRQRLASCAPGCCSWRDWSRSWVPRFLPFGLLIPGFVSFLTNLNWNSRT